MSFDTKMIEHPTSINKEIRINEKFSSIGLADYSTISLKSKSEPVKTEKIIKTSDFLSSLTGTNLDSNILPPNCRFVKHFPSGYIVVVEEQPAIRTISIDINVKLEYDKLIKNGKFSEYNLTKNTYTPRKFTLAFPYVVFFMSFSKNLDPLYTEVYFRTNQILGNADKLFKAPLLNIATDQTICLGGYVGRWSSLATAAQIVQSTFWTNIFNRDYTYNYEDYGDVPMVNTYVEWEYLTQVNPMFIFDVRWKEIPLTVYSTIERMANRCFSAGDKLVGYRKLCQIFEQPKETEKVSQDSERIFRDVSSQYFFGSDMFVINTGDSFDLHEKTFYIYSFLGPAGSITHVQIMSEDGKTIFYKTTKKTMEFLKKKIEEKRFVSQTTLPNSLEIKKGDILKFTYDWSATHSYKKVEFIRENIQGDMEVNLDGEILLVKSISKKAELFDINKPKIKGIELKVGEKYIFGELKECNSILNCYIGEYVDIDAIRNTIYARFKTTDGYKHYSFSSDHFFIKEENANISSSNIIRSGRTLYMSKPNKPRSYNGTLLNFSSRLATVNNSQYLTELINDDQLFISGADLDIEFSIGDNVVVANWVDPLDMLTVKTITGFVIKDEGLYFVLKDKNDNISEIQYITNNGRIFAGMIRKTVSRIDDLTVGTKIIAKKGYIPNFPKKDINIIVAFVIDTGGEPLVLCSNGCTLWYTDVIENFDKIPMTSSKWAKIQHVPIDVSKIKIQPGDIIKGTKYFENRAGYLVCSHKSYPGKLYIQNLDNYHIPSLKSLDNFMYAETVFDCIPEPRLPISKIKELGVYTGLPTFHGTYITKEYVKFAFVNTGKGVLDVSSICE